MSRIMEKENFNSNGKFKNQLVIVVVEGKYEI